MSGRSAVDQDFRDISQAVKPQSIPRSGVESERKILLVTPGMLPEFPAFAEVVANVRIRNRAGAHQIEDDITGNGRRKRAAVVARQSPLPIQRKIVAVHCFSCSGWLHLL